MNTITFTVPGDPQGQPRPRARAVPNGRGGFTATVYQPERERGTDNVVRDLPITTWRRAIAAEVAKVLPPEPWTGPVKLDVVFYLPRTVEMERKKHADGLIPHTSKPDLDNALKPIMDLIVEETHIDKVTKARVVDRRGILRDDCIIAELHTRKWWAERGAGGGAHVVLTRLAAPVLKLPFREPKRTHIGGFKLAEPKPDGWTAAEQMAADMRGEIEG